MDNIYPWRQRTYVDLISRRCTTPVSLEALYTAGGRATGEVRGVSSRKVIEMPDGGRFEEGLDGDGACYRQGPPVLPTWKTS